MSVNQLGAGTLPSDQARHRDRRAIGCLTRDVLAVFGQVYCPDTAVLSKDRDGPQCRAVPQSYRIAGQAQKGALGEGSNAFWAQMAAWA